MNSDVNFCLWRDSDLASMLRFWNPTSLGTFHYGGSGVETTYVACVKCKLNGCQTVVIWTQQAQLCKAVMLDVLG